MRTRLFAVLSLSLACLGTSACGSSTKDPVVPVDPNACPPGQLCPTPTPSVTAPVPTATTTAPAPTATATTSAATPLPPLAGAAVTPVLTGMASTEAPGMKPDGSPFAGQFKEGDTLEQPINIQAGKCYTIVAVGPVVLSCASTTGGSGAVWATSWMSSSMIPPTLAPTIA